MTSGIEDNNLRKGRFISRIKEMMAVNRNKKIPKNENRLRPCSALIAVAINITRNPKGMPYLIAFKKTLSEICSDSDGIELLDKMATSTKC